MSREIFNYGVVDSPYDVRDYRLADCAAKKEELPEEFMLDAIKVKDQGNKSTCVAHTCSEIVEYYNQKQQGEYVRFSTDFIYGYRPSGYYLGEGMCTRDALKTLQKQGDVTYKDLSTNSTYETAKQFVEKDQANYLEKAYPNRISTYFRLYSVDEIKQALYNYGPVALSMKWFDGAYLSKDYEYIYDSGDDYGGHAVLVVGWTKTALIIQNSWGDDWGKKGYFYLDFSDTFNAVVKEAYGTTDTIINNEDIKTPSKLVEKFSKLINAIVNMFKKLFK